MKSFSFSWDSLSDRAFPEARIQAMGMNVSVNTIQSFEQEVTISIPDDSDEYFNPALIFRIGMLIGQLKMAELI